MALSKIDAELTAITTVPSEGGAVTTNIVQGLAKAWASIASDGASTLDSFGISSIDDDGIGDRGLNLTNSMNNVNYTGQNTVVYSHVSGSSNMRNTAIDSKTTSAIEVRVGYVSGSALINNDNPHDVQIVGDLA
tara:strand:+ start:908 stop:1309 length:402 start_codon:yes stop_codon:yes gene_type:complete